MALIVIVGDSELSRFLLKIRGLGELGVCIGGFTGDRFVARMVGLTLTRDAVDTELVEMVIAVATVVGVILALVV